MGLILVVGAVTYANSLTAPFVSDDVPAIVDNVTIRQLWPLSGALQPPPGSPLAGRPVVNLSFAVNYALGGLRVEGYHVANVLIHLLSALVLFGLLRRLLARAGVERLGPATGDRLALVCALGWMVHPLATGAVTHLTQRSESLMGLFFLVTLYASVRAWDTRTRGRWELLAVLTNLCGLGAGTTMVTAPLVVALCDRTFAFGSFAASFRARSRLYLGLAAGWLLFLTLPPSPRLLGGPDTETYVSTWDYLLNQAPVVIEYLRVSLWPVALVFDYGIPQTVALGDVWVRLGVVVLLVVLGVAALWRRPGLGFWAAWFVITLAPASTFFANPSVVGADHRMYLPLVAVVVGVVYLGYVAARRLQERTEATPRPLPARLARWLPAAVTVMVLAGLASLTIARNNEYGSSTRLWETVVDRHPHARAHTLLAAELRRAGRSDDALTHLRLAVPEWPDARPALASVLADRGDLDGAIAELEAFTRLKPRAANITAAREQLAFALFRQEQPDRALAELWTVAAEMPTYVLGRVNLATALNSLGRHDEAITQYREALRLEPTQSVALTGLGDSLEAVGRIDEALEALREAVQVDGLNAVAWHNLLRLLSTQERFDELEYESRRLLSFAPEDAEAHNMLGIALASQQQVDEAIQHFTAAIQLRPDFPEARNNLAQALDLQR